MKYIITEGKLNQMIVSYIDKMYGDKKIYMAKALIDGNEVDGAYDFFTEDYSEGYDEDYLFLWADCDFYDRTMLSDSVRKRKMMEDCPVIEVTNTGHSKAKLNELFGDMWKEPFKEWFTNKFGLPVKTIYST
jgi:hypothetical protein